MKKIISEFRKFITRGNVIDMATGVIMGAAFTSVVNSLVKDAFMPIVGYIIGGINFSDFKIVVSPAVGETPEVAIFYGAFIQQVINFLIVGLVVFVIVKVVNRIQRKKEDEPASPKPSEEAELLAEIRDLLKRAQRIDASK